MNALSVSGERFAARNSVAIVPQLRFGEMSWLTRKPGMSEPHEEKEGLPRRENKRDCGRSDLVELEVMIEEEVREAYEKDESEGREVRDGRDERRGCGSRR